MGRARRAFTLLEILIATGILGGALAVVLSSVSHSARMQQRAVAYLHMSLLGEAKLQEVLCMKDLQDGASDSGSFEGVTGFEWSYQVDEVTLPFFPDGIVDRESELLRITLNVSAALRPTRLAMDWVAYRPKEHS